MRLNASARSSSRLLAVLAAAALVLVACENDDTTGDDTTTDDIDGTDEADPDAAPDPDEDPLGGLEDEEFELPDPTEHVEDEVFRGVGIILPAPDGWHLDEMSFAQGMVIAVDEGGLQTLAGQAVDLDELPEDVELDYEQLLADNREGFDGEPSVDEEVDLVGAARAHLLRFDDLPSPEEGGAPNSLLTIVADDGNGELAMFNYIAPTDDYDEDTETLLLDTAGFDPDSEPAPPMA